jgi:hypothetical protein
LTIIFLRIAEFRLRGEFRKSGPDLAYDAFVSYSSRDESWVMNELVQNLESAGPDGGRFKLCMHERDFKVGLPIADNIVASIKEVQDRSNL